MKNYIVNNRIFFGLCGLIFGAFSGLVGSTLIPTEGYEDIQSYIRYTLLSIGFIGLLLSLTGIYLESEKSTGE